ncbi:MAG: dihydrolipoyl dehydrogenase [Sphaerochaeta sp.]
MAHYDLIIIGSGPGGYIAAQRAGNLGKSVLLIEKDHLGGVCTNKGCIPTKSLLNSAKTYEHAKNGAFIGVETTDITFNVKTAMAHKQETVETLRGGIEFLMKSAQVETIFGEARALDAHHVEVNGTTYECSYLIVATGSSPVIPPIPGAELPHVVTSDEILELTELPSSLVIIGGGVIGLEFASFFSMIGVQVTIIEMLDEILPMAEAEAAKLARRAMKNVTFNLGSTVTKITPTSVFYTTNKGEEKEIAAPMVLMSVGRKPNLSGLEALGLAVKRGAVVVDEQLRTSLPTVYAIGDVNGKSLLAHSASRMADVAVSTIFGSGQKMRYNAIPWVVYSNPEIAGCGLTEAEAVKQGIPVIAHSAQGRQSGRFLAEQGKRAPGLVKVIAHKESGVILGIHLLGPYSSEIIWGVSAILEAELRIQDLKEIVFPHPSVAELIKDVVFALDSSV